MTAPFVEHCSRNVFYPQPVVGNADLMRPGGAPSYYGVLWDRLANG